MLLWGVTIGTLVGGYVPSLWGDEGLSLTSVVAGALGGGAGLWLAFRFTE
jgi:hypothetical protein